MSTTDEELDDLLQEDIEVMSSVNLQTLALELGASGQLYPLLKLLYEYYNEDLLSHIASIDRSHTMGKVIIARELKFAGHHLEPILYNEKHITIRKFGGSRHVFREGETIYGVFEFGEETVRLPLIITDSTDVVPLVSIKPEDYQADGFYDIEHLMTGMERYYGELDPDEDMAIIRFRKGLL